VVVAVVDSGVDAHHADLAGRVLPGADFTGTAINGQADVSSNGHGTSVAGIIAGTGAAGVTGLAPAATILPVRVSDGLASNLSALAQGIDYATTHGAKVINISVCTPILNPQIRDAVDAAISNDVVVVAAGGNDGLAGNPIQYPAALPGVLAVAATDVHGMLWPKSESGGYIGLAAPGVGIYTTGPQGGYLTATGTSFAAPQVSAAVALLRSRYPTENATQIINRLTDTAHSDGRGRTPQLGYGIVDPYQALTANPASATESNSLLAAPAAADTTPAPRTDSRRTAAIAVAAVILAAATVPALIAIRRRRVPKPRR
jgi:type VII secretion-associated serine protease mycosin